MADEHTTLEELLDIEVYDVNDRETTVGNLIDELDELEKEKLRIILLKDITCICGRCEICAGGRYD